MDRTALCSSYRRYKADTDFVVTWLVTNAERCGYMVPDTSTRQSDGLRTIRKTDVKYLVPMAQHVAQSTKPRINVPEGFAYSLHEAISARKRFHAKYDAQNNGTDFPDGADSNFTHKYFIEVLETVQVILRAKLPSHSSFGSEDRKDQPSMATSLANLFGHLDVEDIPDDLLGYETRPHHGTPKTGSYTVEANVDPKESVIAATYLLRDVHNIRSLIQCTWRAYQERRIDLVAASITTNTAIDFIRSIQEDLDVTFTQKEDWHDYICLYCLYLRDNGKSNPDMLPDGFCLSAASSSLSYIIKQYMDDPSEFVTTVTSHHIDLYSSPSDADSKTFHTSAFGRNLAMSILPELCNLARWFPCQQAETEILRGLRQVLTLKKKIFWVTCAVQIYIDIRHALREEVVNGFHDLLEGSKLITSRVNNVLKFHDIAQVRGPVDHDQSLREVLELVDRWTNSDYVEKCRNERMSHPDMVQHMSDYYLLKRDPLWCGLLLYNFRMVAYEGALATINSWSSVLSIAHLYNALEQVKMLKRPWPAMDAVLCAQRTRDVFIGSRPTKPDDFMKRFTTAVGLSVKAFARDRRGKSSTPMQIHTPRQVSNMVPISWAFKGRYCDSNGRADLRPTELKELLNGMMQKPLITMRRDPFEQDHPCNVLFYLLKGVQGEVNESVFDYFLLHRMCWKLLRDLRKRLQEDGHCEIASMRSERELPSIIGLLLVDVVEEQKLRTIINSSRKASDLPYGALIHAAELVEKTAELM